MEDQKKFAVLIDADNVSPERFERIFGEISLFGTATYRRIYGNWAEYNRSMLKEKLVEYALTPVQQFNYIKGKNATDIAMVIEAMDILYTGEVDGFAIVTNDSDFTRLALRLRESGMIVIGMGDDVAPAAFRAACTDFIVLRESRRIAEERTEQRKLRLAARKPSLRAKSDIDGASMKKAAEHVVLKAEEEINETEQDTFEAVSETPAVNEAPAATDKVLSDRELRNAIRDFLFECNEDDGWFSASTMVNKLKEKFPSLDIKDYADLPLFAGKRKIWTTYFLALGFCENKQKGPSNYLLRLKPEERRKLAAERGTDGATTAKAEPVKTETKPVSAVIDLPAGSAVENKAAEGPAAPVNAQNAVHKKASSRRGRSRHKAEVKAEIAETPVLEKKPEASVPEKKPEASVQQKPEKKTAAPAQNAQNKQESKSSASGRKKSKAKSGANAEKAPEVKAELASEKKTETKPVANAEAPAEKKQAAKAEAPAEKKQEKKPETAPEKKAETKSGRRGGRKSAAKAKPETPENTGAKKAEAVSAMPSDAKSEEPKKAAPAKRGRPRKKAAEPGSENA